MLVFLNSFVEEVMFEFKMWGVKVYYNFYQPFTMRIGKETWLYFYFNLNELHDKDVELIEAIMRRREFELYCVSRGALGYRKCI